MSGMHRTYSDLALTAWTVIVFNTLLFCGGALLLRMLGVI